MTPTSYRTAADIALAIDALYLEATNNPCTCGSLPEDYCRFCGSWEKAHRETEKLICDAIEGAGA